MINLQNLVADMPESTIHIPTFFQVTPYTIPNHERHCKYPTYHCHREAHRFYRTKEEALAAVRVSAEALSGDNIYCIVVSEIPLGTPMFEGESFSEQLYLADGTLWGERAYAQIVVRDVPEQYGEIEYDNYLYGRCAFYGRKAEEIRFQKGDIIEIFCHPGNSYWGDDYIELAIVVDTPPTEEKMAEWINLHLSDTEHRTGDRGFDVGTRFSAWDDTYKVIPAYRSLHDDVGNLIDECPTHCAFAPHQKVSARMRNKLLRQLERVS